MQLLVDSSVWGGVRTDLSVAGYDVVWVGDWPEDPGDEDILTRAHAEGRILITRDKDFGELAVLRGLPHSGILRLADTPARQQAAVCLRVLEAHGAALQAGAIVTADPFRVRIRLPDSLNGAPPAGGQP
jgi:predicted nuclease of predicted toxin-antitoxin system